MEKIGIDVHKVASQVCIQMDDGTFLERRIATTPAAFAKLLGGRARARASCSRRRPRASGWRGAWKGSGTR